MTFTAPADLIEAVEEKLARSGTTLDIMLRLALRGYLGRPDVFHLDTAFTFGKYRDETLEDVMRADTRYVLWCLTNLPAFAISEEANDLLNDLLPEAGMHVRRYHQGGDYENVVFVPDGQREKPLDEEA